MSFLSKIFGASSPTNTPADIPFLKCDIHSHFIPGIDDGAKTIEESLTMLKELSSMGYRKVITTPHIMSDTYRNTPKIILNGLAKLREAVKLAGIYIEVDAAAEYYLDFEFEKLIEKKMLLTFGKPVIGEEVGKYVLFELPFINPPDSLTSVVFKLLTNGYKPVLAHPERYNFWHHKIEKFEELIEKGVLLQLNINSLTGHYSSQVKIMAEQLIDQNMISFLGSDCHHAGHIDLMKKAVYKKQLHKLIGSGKLLNNTL